MAKQFDLSVVFKIVDGASKPLQQIGKRFSFLQRPIDAITRSSNRFAKTLTTAFPKADRSARKLNQTLNRLGKSARATGKRISDVGKNLSLKLTAPIVAFAGLATKAAIDFESAFTGVIKTVNASEEELKKLRTGFEKLSIEIPVSATELFGIGEAAGQLGIETKSILSFTKVMADLGATTNLTSDEAATSLARIANIVKLPQDQFDRLGSTIVDLGNNFATTEAEIVEMGKRLAAAGNQVGLTIQQTLGLAAGLTSVGINAEAGGTAFSQVMKRMGVEVAKNTTNVKRFASVAGLSTKTFAKLFKEDAAEALLLFTEGLGQAQKEGKNVSIILEDLGFDSIRIADSLLRAAGSGDLFRKAIATGSKAFEENNALAKEAALRYKTTASQITILKNRLILMGSTFGDLIIPKLIQFVKFVSPIIDRLRSLDDRTKTIILVIAGLAAVIGPLLIALGLMVASAGAVLTAITGLAALLGTTTAAIIIMGSSIIALGSLFAAAATVIIKNWKPIKGFFSNLFSDIGESFKAITNLIPDFLKSQSGEKGKSFFGKLSDFVTPDFLKSKSEPIEQIVRNKNTGAKQEDSKTQIDIKVSSDQGSTSTIEKVKSQGPAKVNLSNTFGVGMVGATS